MSPGAGRSHNGVSRELSVACPPQSRWAEAYNLLNTVNFENPSGVITSGSFTTYTPRYFGRHATFQLVEAVV